MVAEDIEVGRVCASGWAEIRAQAEEFAGEERTRRASIRFVRPDDSGCNEGCHPRVKDPKVADTSSDADIVTGVILDLTGGN